MQQKPAVTCTATTLPLPKGAEGFERRDKIEEGSDIDNAANYDDGGIDNFSLCF